jgi:osmoprotectant transport system permease protein
MENRGVSDRSVDHDDQLGERPGEKKNRFGRGDGSSPLSGDRLRNLLNWTVIPVLMLLVILYVYSQILLTIEPDSMEANIIGSSATGFGNVWDAVVEHLRLILISTGLAIAVGVPAGILITREGFRDFSGLILGVANIGQSVPSIAVLAVFMGILGLGARTAIFALWLYALLPIVRNTATGIEEVDPSIIEAATGMGMTSRQILLQIELPLAFPVMFAGMRTAAVINVGTAALGAFIGAGGLGGFIITGIPLNRDRMILVGAIYTAVMAVLVDWTLGKIEDRLVAPTARAA